MKHMTIVDYSDGSNLKEKVYNWISENEEEILEIIDIEYENSGNIFYATVTYEERNENG
ncbi:hypothetical protein [Anaerosalibacter massiliensis]|uniref:Uncharacterized protein n=1 Tax=Anaerosalibacter massiliensis TaxID=1347392 RepID=A0A9X2S820_9FIRM|nr:hypothetical protein [Anaerosalibacter massiliensis]MCR2044641.1 hypothetical protein [Anaerosalibacter massiliensis]